MSSYESYRLLRVSVAADGVATVSIWNPPMNLITGAMIKEFATLVPKLAEDPKIRAVILRSDVPDFFAAHADLEMLSRVRPQGSGELNPSHWRVGGFQAIGETLRTMPKPTICSIDGRCGGGGSEIALSCDIRFASKKAIFNQFEVSLGMIPGGSGTVRLARLCGRSRAMEIVLGCEDYTAEEAEKYGWINRVFPTTAALDAHVSAFASRIARMEPNAVARAKRSILRAERGVVEDLLAEADDINEQFKRDNLPDNLRMQKFLKIGGQTIAGEKALGVLAGRL